MKRSNLIKLLSLIICAMMLVSVFASCDNGESKTTNAPEDDTTEAPVQTPTEAPDDETTEAPETDAPETDAPEETDPETDAPECGGIHREWSSSVEGHWRDACQYCGGGAVELKAHAVDYNDEGVYCCLVCGFEPECKNIHWTWDSLNHYMPACDKCGFEGDEFAESPHFFITTEEGEFVCDTCGYVPECKGVHAWEADADTHSAPACDKCGAEAVEAMPHTVAEVVEGNAIKYACTECQYVCAERILPESVTAYINADMMSKREASAWVDKEAGTATKDGSWVSTTHFSMAGQAVITDDIVPYFTFTKGTGHATISQFIWNRDAAKCSAGDNAATWPGEKFVNNVGKAAYLVIKVRVADNTQDFGLVMSTVGTSGAINELAVTKLGYGMYGDPRVTAHIPVSAAEAGTWATYAINLEMVCENAYNPSADGTYDIDTFYFHITNKADASAIDIEYMAFVEDDIEGITAMADAAEYYVVTDKAGAYTTVVSETMTCKDDKHVNGNCDDKCDVCGADGVAAGAHHNADCGDDVCDDCGATGVQGVAHKNANCNDDTCDVCGATEVAGPAHVNADCGDELCDVCGAEGIAGAPHVNVNCDDDICDNCGVNGLPVGEHVMDCIAEEGEDGTKTYVATCMTCGFEHKVTVPASVNFYGGLDTMGFFTGNESTLTRYHFDGEANVMYNHITTASQTHVNITGGGGNGEATADTYVVGKYLIVKYRSGVNKLTISAVGASKDNKGSLGSNIASEWTVSVIDMQALIDAGNIKTEETNLYIMLLAHKEADIAYVATVDTLDEMRELVTDETYIYHGTSFSEAGEVRNTADDTPKS